MKPLYFPAFLFICVSTALFSANCTKEHGISLLSPCDSCGQSDAGHLSTGIMQLEDSAWERLGAGLFKSEITRQLNDAEISVNQVYALYIIRDGNPYQIFPNREASYMSGVIFGSVFSSGDSQACIIMYSDIHQELHYGEAPAGGFLPFRSATIQVLYMH